MERVNTVVYVAKEKLYMNADRSQVVPENSPEAAFVLVGPGGKLTDEQCKKYGLGPYAKTPKTAPSSDTQTEEKAMEAPANKMASKSTNKRRTGRPRKAA